MRLPVNLLLCIVVITSTALSVTAEPYCAKQNQTDEPRFTQKLGSVDYVRLSHQIAILCCAEGYDRISWYRLEENIWKKFPPPPHGDDNTPEVEESGQILRILDAKLTDQTSYRCDVEGKTKVIPHTTYLRVIECDPLTKGPIPTDPSPVNKTIYEYGGNLTFHCTGYFGCQDGEQDWQLQLVLWMTGSKTVQSVSSRYSVKIFENRNMFTKQADFTISDVNEEDEKRTFYCILARPQGKQSKTFVRIFKRDKAKIPWEMIGFIIGGCLVFVIIVIILMKCLQVLYGPRISLFFNSRISFLGPRTVDKEKFPYNLFIYHAEEDERTAQFIKRNLKDRKYEVTITADLVAGQHMMISAFDQCRQSAMVLFLYSDALRENDLANFILQSLITERKGKDIMFLEVSKYKPEEAMDWTIHARDINELQTGIGNQGQLVNNAIEDNTVETEFENFRSIAENDGVDGVENNLDNRLPDEKKKTMVDDLEFWKVLPRIKLPDDEKNKRKMENFWCSLQNKIPKFMDQRQTLRNKSNSKDSKNSMNEPLLNNCRDSEPLTPLSQTQSPNQEVSRNTAEVFSFGEANGIEQHLPERENQENRNQTSVDSKIETVIEISNRNPEDESSISLTNRLQEPVDNGIVRGETAYESMTGRDNELAFAADVHHRESSNLSDTCNRTIPNLLEQNNTSHVKEEVEETTKAKSREDIFTMSDEESKPPSFETESGYSEENTSGRGTQNASEEGNSFRYASLSSSGVSDLNSEGSLSPQNQLNHDYTNGSGYTDISVPVNAAENINIPTDRTSGLLHQGGVEDVKGKGNGKLNLIINPPGMRRSSNSTPESGYITSPSERSMSYGGFLLKNERKIDAISEEQ